MTPNSAPEITSASQPAKRERERDREREREKASPGKGMGTRVVSAPEGVEMHAGHGAPKASWPRAGRQASKVNSSKICVLARESA